MKFYGGLLLGFLLGAVTATAGVVWSQSGITSPYDSSQLMGQTNLYNAIITLQAEQRRQQDRANDAANEADWNRLYRGAPCR